MDQQKQPTEGMLAEARRLAFFADEVLSQDIMNSHEKTEGYIKRHTQKLVDQKVIKPKVEYYAYTPEEIKTYNKWFNSIMWKSTYFPVLIYLLISWYFINTPMEHWFFNLGQYNSLLLQWFPSAQHWVNISTDHREKMILLYLIYTFFFWLIFTLIIYHVVFNFKKFTSEYVSARATLCGRLGLVLLVTCMFFVFFVTLAIPGTLVQGSEAFLMPSELDNSARKWMLRDDSKWNSTTGFLLNKSLGLVMFILLLLMVRTAPLIWFCKKTPK